MILLQPVIFAGFNQPAGVHFLSQKMAVVWNVPPNEEGEGWGRNVSHWQLNRGAVKGGRRRRRRSAATELQSMDSLSLSTSGEDFALLWRNTEGLTLDWGHRCQEHISTCSTTVSCFAITVQIVLIFLHFLWRIWIKVSLSPVLWIVCIVGVYTKHNV